MRVAVQKLGGVQSVEVSLNNGLAEIRLAPANRVSITQLRQIIRSKGFTPKDAEVVVSGTIIEHEGAPALALDGTTPAFRLLDAPSAQGAVSRVRSEAAGRRTVVRGRVPETGRDTAGQLPLLEVRGIL